jgi:ABC-2 type transport system permease protein
MATAKSVLQPINTNGRLMGFASMFRKENNAWWRSRTWLVHSIIWLLLVNGILFGVLKSPPLPEGIDAPPPPSGTMIFVIMSGLMTGLGIILVMQGSILDEQKSGTAAWVLSKPLSRSAFILAKLAANSLAALLIMVVLQGVVAYVQMQAFAATPPDLLPFLAGMGLLALHLLFYLTLTLMLGTIFKDRAVVMGITIGLLYGAQFVAGMFPLLVKIMPWQMVMPINEHPQALADLVMRGQPLPTVTPIIGTVVLIIAFVGVALWRFEREEF